jgi:uncharacterized protein (TIGR02246 family)
MSARAVGVPVATTAVSNRGPMPAAVPASATAPATVARRPARPIPEVIAKAKRFSVAAVDPTPDASDAVAMSAAATHTADGQFAPRRIEHETDGHAADVAGIGGMIRSYLQAFNRHDATSLAAHWSPVGENLDLDSGETTSGREAVREVFAALFEEDAGATIGIDLTSIRPLRDDVAIVDGVSRITFTDGTASSSRFSAVVVRQAGRWMLDTVREASVPLQAAATSPLDDLAWLLGSWEDVSDGVTASTHCFWAADRSFLVRSHIVTDGPAFAPRPLPGDDRIPGLLPPGGGGSREITEIIGWDPDRRQIRSWLFTSGGRFAEGSWSREGDAWTVQLDAGTAGDCVYTLSRLGADDLSCRCSVDGLGEIMPPACDFVRTARAAPPPEADAP